MHIFSKIFGNGHTSGNGHANQDQLPRAAGTHTDYDSISKEVFVDETPPNIKPSESRPHSGNVLKEFLEENYFMKGFNDGYDTHSREVLDRNKLRIGVEFRYVIDQVIDQMESERFSLRNHLISVGDTSDEISKQLEARIEELKARVEQLRVQRAQSMEEEGWVMHPIHDYVDGFVRGIQRYSEERFFAASTGLFNPEAK